MQRRAADGAVDAISQATLRAAMTVVGLLDLRRGVWGFVPLKDLLDRQLGKPMQRQSWAVKDGAEIRVRGRNR